VINLHPNSTGTPAPAPDRALPSLAAYHAQPRRGRL